MIKTGVNNTRAEKAGPIVRKGIGNSVKKVVTCSVCKCKLEKSCPNEMLCEVSVLKCPKCGTEVV